MCLCKQGDTEMLTIEQIAAHVNSCPDNEVANILAARYLIDISFEESNKYRLENAYGALRARCPKLRDTALDMARECIKDLRLEVKGAPA